MQKIKDFPYLTIYWDETNNVTISEWKGGFVKGDNLKNGLNEALTFFIEKKGKKWLGNTKELGVFGIETQKWINEDWFPRFLATGVKYMAVVIPSDALGKMSVEAVVSTVAGTGLGTHFFDSSEAALKWLVEQK
jgi:hypothetical protein